MKVCPFCFELHCPVKPQSRKKSKRLQKPWISDTIFEKIREKNDLYTELLNTNDPFVRTDYKNLRNQINHDICNK